MKQLNKIKYKLKRSIFDLIFRKEGTKMVENIVNQLSAELYLISKRLRPNGPLKIRQPAKDYLMVCLAEGRPIDLLTQLCVSKDLEVRLDKQEGCFRLLPAEREVFTVEMPRIITLFKKWGFGINWYLTFNQSYLDSGRVNSKVAEEFKKMIILAGQGLNDVTFWDWEEDILRTRPKPNSQVLKKFDSFVSKKVFQMEASRHSVWAKEEAGIQQSKTELENDVKFQIACEAEEAKYITSDLFPDGFLLIPLENAERYDFFRLIVPNFNKYLVTVLNPYPWRLKQKEVKNEPI